MGVDRHALYAGVVQPVGGAGTGSGSRGGNKRGGRYKQQQQHSQPNQNGRDNPGPNPVGTGGHVRAGTGGQVRAETGGQVPAMGRLPTDLPSRVLPPTPRPPVRNPTGCGLPPNPVSWGQKGAFYRCHRPSHYIAECPISPAHMNVEFLLQINNPSTPCTVVVAGYTSHPL